MSIWKLNSSLTEVTDAFKLQVNSCEGQTERMEAGVNKGMGQELTDKLAFVCFVWGMMFCQNGGVAGWQVMPWEWV